MVRLSVLFQAYPHVNSGFLDRLSTQSEYDINVLMTHDITTAIDEAAAGIRFESVDFTVGELLNLKRSKELIIDPDFQRLFRWTREQRSRLIESLLLGLPIPQVFLFQTPEGELELIDGLQRISSLIHFIDYELLAEEIRNNPLNNSPLKLHGCDISTKLNGETYESLPKVVQLELRRKPIRAIVIKRTNEQNVRFQMFKRLNSGGSAATSQEVRNAVVRILGAPGVKFLTFLEDCSRNPNYVLCTDTLSDSSKEASGLQELVLRYLALKNYRSEFRGSVTDWLDDYIESILIDGSGFDYDSEKDEFESLFAALAEKLGSGAFVKYRDGRPIGGLAPAYFEAVTMGVRDSINVFVSLTPTEAKERLMTAVSGDSFRAVTGSSANTQAKMSDRIRIIQEAFS